MILNYNRIPLKRLKNVLVKSHSAWKCTVSVSEMGEFVRDVIVVIVKMWVRIMTEKNSLRKYWKSSQPSLKKVTITRDADAQGASVRWITANVTWMVWNVGNIVDAVTAKTVKSRENWRETRKAATTKRESPKSDLALIYEFRLNTTYNNNTNYIIKLWIINSMIMGMTRYNIDIININH